ncbi:M50 family metallopeptidase [Kribbella sp. NPDC058693]|uniref:M50 family metallopeptidase n=1 Tax=Kribbella jiaozuonensis TaxID=2575441 RepID=A0A4U3LWK7_9ACTN|nr:M50 family metallopeptidase [Kribbella jiaozuonensis]TKK79216.1 M50 family metallopeptidase [Kribbella jiaozuonensis]TKK83286.1 M50 family metallopeptidase [Kribbella jiaozuonensis]
MSEFWNSITSVQPEPSLRLVIGTGVVALLLIAWRPLWQYTRQVVTIAHEGAHGLIAALVGRKLAGIRLHSDTSGVTVSRGKPNGAGMIAVLLAGYPGPALFGLAAAFVLSRGYAVALLWGLLLALVILLLQIRNLFGLWSVLVFGAVVFGVSWWGSAEVQTAFAHLLTWFLLLAAPRAVLELQRSRRGGQGRSSDADQLRRLTGVPALLWVGVFGLVTLFCLAVGFLWSGVLPS